MRKEKETLDRLKAAAESILDELAQLEVEINDLADQSRLRADVRRAQATLDGVKVKARARNTGRQDRWTRSNMVVISGKLPNNEARQFVAACEARGITPYAALNAAARSMIGGVANDPV